MPQKIDPKRNKAGTSICGAKLRNKDAICQSTILYPSNGRCRLHGGSTPGGIGSPHYKHGRYVEAYNRLYLGDLSKDILSSELYDFRNGLLCLQLRVFQLLEDGNCDESKRWREIGMLEERMDRIRTRAHRRAVDAKVLIHIDSVRGVMTCFVSAIQAVIEERFKELGLTHELQKTLSQIGEEYRRRFGIPSTTVERDQK